MLLRKFDAESLAARIEELNSEPVIILYHGTSSVLLERILKDGLLPAEVTGNSPYDVLGRNLTEDKRCVYLSDDYLLANDLAWGPTEAFPGESVVIELEVPVKDLIADEDVAKYFGSPLSWQLSLAMGSTCAHVGGDLALRL